MHCFTKRLRGNAGQGGHPDVQRSRAQRPPVPASRRHPRGLIDCMIDAVAWRYRAALLACHADLDRVAAVIGIELDQPAQAGYPGRTARTVRGARTTFR